ncbi:oligoribonuclease [Nigerium massiliense]|uniref:oligoribonuclease n=1 Tax=Nigerium massiliense TaxID=1522317 RepID=UPI0009079D12|nr:oligoribonuclease [Nigerium massiliense]
MNDRLVWIDCEMTGLDLASDALIEVAALVTDGELNVLGEGLDVIIKPSDEALATMGDFVRTMHTKSGLLDELPEGLSMAEAEDAVLAYITEYVPTARQCPLAGNSIGTDRAFLARDMPRLEGHVHYRNVDVSTLKELARRWQPRVYFNAPAKHGNHRALADIQESIEELRYYRDAFITPAPGHSPAELKAIAAKHEASITGIGQDATPAPATEASDTH